MPSKNNCNNNKRSFESSFAKGENESSLPALSEKTSTQLNIRLPAVLLVLVFVTTVILIAMWLFIPDPPGAKGAEPIKFSQEEKQRIASASEPPLEALMFPKLAMHSCFVPSRILTKLQDAHVAYIQNPRLYDFAVNSVKNTWKEEVPPEKIVYLTFDDGPSSMTPQVLDVLKRHDVKATFFVTCQYPDCLHYIKEAHDAGHTIALHTGSHNYAKLYASEAAYFADLEEVGNMVKNQIGYVPCFVRFPGGASNTISRNYSRGIMSRLASQLLSRGYQYYDWTASTGDGGTVNKDQAYANAIKGNGQPYVMILCHDTPAKQSTCDALSNIIEFYKSQGYKFRAIDRNTPITHQNIAN